MFSAVLDTCTLIPGRQRDFLLQLAAEGAYGAVWSSGTVDDELVEVLLRLDARRGRVPDRVRHERLVNEMKRHFPGSTIQAPRMRRYHYRLADPDDGHVVHAAIMGKASAIVTSDRKARFESCTDLLEAQIEVLTPQEFAANTVAAHPAAGVRAVSQMARRRRKPPESPMEILQLLRDRQGMREVYDILAAYPS